MKRFVVGVNRGRASRDALTWAYGAAVREGARLAVVTAYRPAVVVGPFDGYVVDDRYAREAACAEQDDALSSLLGRSAAETPIDRLVLVGEPAFVLVKCAAHASLLVVGRRSRRWKWSFRPSTAMRCADRAACPVVIVREQPLLAGHGHDAELRQLEHEILGTR
jgi:nucleotide-binding universal stress UspA family protein